MSLKPKKKCNVENFTHGCHAGARTILETNRGLAVNNAMLCIGMHDPNRVGTARQQPVSVATVDRSQYLHCQQIGTHVALCKQ